jgi:hypothetical protein
MGRTEPIDLVTDSAYSTQEWRIQCRCIDLHWCNRPSGFANTLAVPGAVADPDGHHVPAMEPVARSRCLANDNPVQQRLRGVGVWTGEQQPVIMAEEPGVQSLHATEIRNLDKLRMRRLPAHKATPRGKGTTVLAGGSGRSLCYIIEAADARRKSATRVVEITTRAGSRSIARSRAGATARSGSPDVSVNRASQSRPMHPHACE